jgi:glycogen phosphorylase
MATNFLHERPLPKELYELNNLALDLFWTWSHGGDRLWRRLDPDLWEKSKNPWVVLQGISNRRLKDLVHDSEFRRELVQLVDDRRDYLHRSGWYEKAYPESRLRLAAYFSMEFGLAEALPMYAGGLGILAGDFLKAASDLGVPVVGVGLLFQEGYFRQFINGNGDQEETYPYNEPANMPIRPVEREDGTWLRVAVDLPGRQVHLRVWYATVGRTTLYLLDSNDPLNSPIDRGVTAKLYGGGHETRLLQEMVLGIGGWRALEAQGLDVDICHLNEGHAAFVILERARCFAQKSGLSFWEALWATRGGNVFTTHTPVPAGFDTYDVSLLKRFLPFVSSFHEESAVTLNEFLALGRQDEENSGEAFNLVYLALRGCSLCNGVSELHGSVSRRLFQPLFPRWPVDEVPVAAVTNAVHMPSWDSAISDELWTRCCGKDRWQNPGHQLSQNIEYATDEDLWTLRGQQREELIQYLRMRIEHQLRHRGSLVDNVIESARLFDPNTLTLGFARRFTDYKRPTLLLKDQDRLRKLLTNPGRPVQIVVAGKAHPEDEDGKSMVREWVEFANQPSVRSHVAFIEDYDISVAMPLIQGVDVWLNTPRRGWEACGTSGMKALVNGGLNLSELDGWWAEAYSKDVGWALGESDRVGETQESNHDGTAADRLYEMLENDVIPCFYERDQHGLPRRWLQMVRTSMGTLAPAFNSGRMVQDYIERIYHPASETYNERVVDNGALARELSKWEVNLRKNWHQLHFGQMEAIRENEEWLVSIPVYLGEVEPDCISIQLYAEPKAGDTSNVEKLTRGESIPGSVNGFVYTTRAPSSRPIEDYTARIVPYHPKAVLPTELALIHWQH